MIETPNSTGVLLTWRLITDEKPNNQKKQRYNEQFYQFTKTFQHHQKEHY